MRVSIGAFEGLHDNVIEIGVAQTARVGRSLHDSRAAPLVDSILRQAKQPGTRRGEERAALCALAPESRQGEREAEESTAGREDARTRIEDITERRCDESTPLGTVRERYRSG